jgi:hypothetical protein
LRRRRKRRRKRPKDMRKRMEMKVSVARMRQEKGIPAWEKGEKGGSPPPSLWWLGTDGFGPLFLGGA